jgi:tetratricopeptide (TPR) repeat protein
MAAERFTEAEEAFGRAVRADRLLAHAHYRQGQAFMALHRFPSAIRAFSASRDAHRELLGLVQRERLQALSQRPGAHVRFQVPRNCRWRSAARISATASSQTRSGSGRKRSRRTRGSARRTTIFAALYAMTARKQQAEEAVLAAERSGFRVNPQLKQDITSLEYQSARAADGR